MTADITSATSETSSGTTRNRIVVGVDGSEPSKQALRWAARLAEPLGAQLEVVAAWQYAYTFGLAYIPMAYDPASDTEKALSETVDEVFGGEGPQGMRLTTIEGGAAPALLHASEGATMLVVGSRGHGGFAGLLLGSVSANVAEHATCPVLVVHAESSMRTEPGPGLTETESAHEQTDR